MSDEPEKTWLTPTEVAKLLMVSPVTVRQWAQKGMLSAETTPGGHRRYLRSSVERFAREHGMTFARRARPELRVLIVDDDPFICTYLVELLEGSPHAVITATAHDGFDAGRKLAAFHPDVVLLDLRIPGIDGIEVCRSLKQDPATRATRVIAISGHVTPEATQKLRTAGAEHVLRKPLDPVTLFEAIGLQTLSQKSGTAS